MWTGPCFDCEQEMKLTETNTNRVRVGELKNAPTARVMPGSKDHRGLAEYWGTEAATALRGVVSGENVQLNSDHAWRCAKIAAYHWTRWRKLNKEMF